MRGILDPETWDRLQQPNGSPVAKVDPVSMPKKPQPPSEEEKQEARERL